MNVPPVAPRLHLSTTPTSSAPAAGGPADRFAPSNQTDGASDALRRAAQALTKAGEIRKSESKYRPAAFTRDADGQMYIGYTEGYPGKKSYLASVAPDGRIAWEAPLGEVKVQHVGVTAEGVLIGTADGHLLLTRDGRLGEALTGGPEVRSHHRDSTGMHLEVLSADGTMRAVAPDGTPRDLPPEVASLRVRSVEPTPEGGLFVFTDQQLVRIDPGGGGVTMTPTPQWERNGKLTYNAAKAWPLEGGDVMVHRHSYLTITPRGPHRFMRPGMGGGYFDPDHWAPDTVTRSAFVRIAPDGTQRWATDDTTEQSRIVVCPNGTVLLQNGNAPQGFSGVQRITPDGKFEQAFQVKGTIEDFRTGVKPGTVLIRHDDKVERFDAAGTLLGSVALGDKRGMQIEADLEDGRVLFRDGFEGELWAADPATGAWVRMTDPDVDHSLRPEDLLPDPTAQEPAREVQETEGWVVIGDVSLPRSSR